VANESATVDVKKPGVKETTLEDIYNQMLSAD